MKEYYNDWYEPVKELTDIHGRPIEKTPRSYPYSFDAFCVFKSKAWSPMDSVCFSDRLMQWDYDKFTDCMKEVWGERAGQHFDNKEPEDIQKFLRWYYSRNVVLTGIEKGCNVGNGYPYWIFYYKDVI